MADPMSDTLKQAQSVFHGSAATLVLPACLFAVSSLLVLYRNFFEVKDVESSGPLTNTLIQMVPLCAFKLKIWSCPDRISLVPLVLCKTLLMHAVLASYRLMCTATLGVDDKVYLAADVAGFVGALAIMKWEFQFPMDPLYWIQLHDVRNLIFLASFAAFLGHAFVVYEQPNSKKLEATSIMFTAANYVDLIAFMPVVWQLHQAEEAEDSQTGTSVTSSAKRQVRIFFLYVLLFYSFDDIFDPLRAQTRQPMYMMAHAAHFVMLMDFAGFFLFQVDQPASVKDHGEQLQGLLARDDDDDHF